MTSKAVAHLLVDLGVTKTHSRPYVSNDNPYSEAQFKTLKYCPTFPDRFGCIEDARTFCRSFFAWYNQEHKHSGIGLMTPEQVHYGQAQEILEYRSKTLAAAFRKFPSRFKGKMPIPMPLPEAAWINKPLHNENRKRLLNHKVDTILGEGPGIEIPGQAGLAILPLPGQGQFFKYVPQIGVGLKAIGFGRLYQAV